MVYLGLMMRVVVVYLGLMMRVEGGDGGEGLGAYLGLFMVMGVVVYLGLVVVVMGMVGWWWWWCVTWGR